MTSPKPRKSFSAERYGSLVALAILVVLSSILSPHFLQVQNLLNILRQVSYTGIIALGMTFVIIAGGSTFPWAPWRPSRAPWASWR